MPFNEHSSAVEIQTNSHPISSAGDRPCHAASSAASPTEAPLPWWQSQRGLAFSCTGCGRCCSGEPGAVWLSQADQEALARHFDLDLATFLRRFCRWLNGRIALVEHRRWNLEKRRWDYDCVLLKGGRFCQAYEARPTQCRTFPFWPENVASPDAWQRLALRGCEGIGQGEELIEPTVIHEQLQNTQTVPGFGRNIG